MADTSLYSVEERLVVSVWAHERPHTGKTMEDVRQDFTRRFHKNAPPKMTILRWEKKLFLLGCIKDKPRPGAPVKRQNTCAGVEASVLRSPQKSLRKRSSELGIPKTTMLRHMKKDLQLKAFKPATVNELSDDDLRRRHSACARLLEVFPTLPRRADPFFSDECAIYRSARARNVYFWSKQNPHYYEELEHNPPHVMIWVAMSAKHLIGPYFFDGVVNQHTYLAMLQEFFVPELQRMNLLERSWFQQDGAPPHYAITVRQYLNEVFPNKWIGRGSVHLPAPLDWPPRSPDLTSCDNALWGIIKAKVSQQRYQTTEQLKDAVRTAFAAINRNLLRKISHRSWRRIILCHENNGGHTDLLDA